MCSSIKFVIVLTVNCILKNTVILLVHSLFWKDCLVFGSLGKGVIQILAVEQFIRL